MTKGLTLLEMTIRMEKQAMQRAFEHMGIEVTVDQWQLMSLIAEHPACSQRQLADLSGKDPASITRMLDVLEKLKLIERQSIEGNRRQFSLALSTRGIALLKSYRQFVEDLTEAAFTDFSKGEKESFAALLLRIQSNVSEIN